MSRCGRYRITVAPGDDGAILEIWREGNWFDRRAGEPRRVMWRREGRIELPLPFHAALDRAHDALAELTANGSITWQSC